MAPETAKDTRAALRRRYLKLDTATVADVLDHMGHPDQGLASSFQPYPANAGKMAGWAYTIRGRMPPSTKAPAQPRRFMPRAISSPK